MMRVLFALTAVVLAGLSLSSLNAKPDEPKQVKMTGTLVCMSCTLGEGKKCANALQVKEKDKLVNYILDDKGTKEDYHEGVCGGGKIENVTVTGVVSEKDGKKIIKPSKVDIKK